VSAFGFLYENQLSYLMAVDGLLPGVFTKVHSAFRIRRTTTAVAGIISAGLAACSRSVFQRDLLYRDHLKSILIECRPRSQPDAS
jgi:hypothetical protein